ncbi:MAG: hypothetical protein D8M58_04210 [Calditrichaeota bacterium]|nr:MAG: hypothetical protein DWQ03_02865 [Calditrichota bacterium]MBL1204573.1 hypothetical protein [Calditrichota bacterium]NOG44402.1 hypothetical protein [Calditrichota bacterium]
METEIKKACLFCDRDEHEIPLISLVYQGNSMWICPQHMPNLIHNPSSLEGKLPGAENMDAAEH